jgi:hypothetical protein
MMPLPTCPKCGSQLEVKLIFASGPRSSPEPVEPFNIAELHDLLEGIDADNLEPRAMNFVTETRERLEKYGERIKISPKQMAWLRSIAKGKSNKDNWE